MSKQFFLIAFCLVTFVALANGQISLIPKISLTCGTYQMKYVADNDYLVGMQVATNSKVSILS